MIAINPEILKRDNKADFAILDYNEYHKLPEYIQDIEDLVDLRNAKADTKDEATISLDKVKETLGID
ncbi:MAG: type II toxin-antitoxin system Phd/YefM family antitoxin [Candidatus Zhuqueibacterota bacterium]